MNIKRFNFNSISTTYYISIITLITALSIGLYLDLTKYDNHMILNKEHNFKMEIDKMKIDRGVAVLNDKLIIPPTRISKNETNRKRFAELSDPFTIIKKSGESEFIVIKFSDTLIFEFDGSTDPTFTDFFDNVFNN